MHPLAVDRSSLLSIARGTLAELQRRETPSLLAARATAAGAASSVGQAQVERDIVVGALVSAIDHARAEGDATAAASMVAGAAVGREPAPGPYLPSIQALALVQSAIEEFQPAEGGPAALEQFDTRDPGWLAVAWEKLKALFRGKHAFIEHTTPASFREVLPDDAVVALFSDWGTGEETARRVMRQIALQQPTHAIHLGDVYYSGTEKEVRTRFLDVIATDGPRPADCRFLALNSNHEMYSGGHAYFELTLRQRFAQEASYFNLTNAHWQLIGLDTGYEDHGLQDPQDAWLAHQVSAAGPRNILLTHHQLFSPWESRAADQPLHRKIEHLLPRVFGWFWGHEHKAIVFGEHQGLHARCIGHGAIPEPVPYGAPRFDVPIRATDDRPAAPGASHGLHGFALLRFNGPSLQADYIDEFGKVWFTEPLTSL